MRLIFVSQIFGSPPLLSSMTTRAISHPMRWDAIQASLRAQNSWLIAFTIVTTQVIDFWGLICTFWNYHVVLFGIILSIAVCSMAHCIDELPQYQSVNTQVAEQSNSFLYRLRSMLSYMNESNFHKNLQLFLAFRNNLSRARYGMPVQYTELFDMMSLKFKV